MSNTVDKRKNVETIYPLSPMQQGMLFHSLLTPEEGVYIPQVCFDLVGNLDIVALQQAWQEVIAQHTTLRTAFYWERRDKPFQVAFRQVALPWEVQDWQAIPTEQQLAQLEAWLLCDRQQGFDLQQPPLMRLTLIQRSATQFWLIWTQHHLLLDGWSAALIANQVFGRYFSPVLPLPIPRPYGDYIAWISQQDQTAAQTFWKHYLQGFSIPTALSSLTRSPDRAPSRRFKPAEQFHHLSPETTAALSTFAQQHQLTLNTLIQGAFALLLSHYCAAQDVVFGATSSGRPAGLSGVESMVGLFINTLPVRVQMTGDATIVPWLQALQMQQSEVLQYEFSALLDIQSWSELPSGMPLFDSIVVVENYPVTFSQTATATDLQIASVRSLEWTSFPITILVSGHDCLTFQLKYDQAQFSHALIHQLLTHFEYLLHGMVAAPQRHLRDIPLLTASELHQRNQWHQTTTPYPETCIHQQFEAQVAQTPDAIAVLFEHHSLTYAELNRHANQLAHYLQSLGIQPDRPVGMLLPRSLDMAIVLLAILKAGAAYVPLEPSYPAERINLLLHDTQPPILITQTPNSQLPTPNSLKVICLDRDRSIITQQPDHNPTSAVQPDHAIYILYTSGSTGTPKGVINTHRGISNRLAWMQQAFGLSSTDVVLQKTPFSFDVSVWEFFWTWLNGACLVISQPDGHRDPCYLIDVITHYQVTTIHFVPSMLSLFLDHPDVEKCTSLKRVVCSGEALSIELQNRFWAQLTAQLYNLYGPTEAAIDVSYWHCQPHSLHATVPIGFPIANTQLHILNADLQPVPTGVAGELYIGGVGLARGYWNRPDLTAERFIPNPFAHSLLPTPHSHLYKTGDRARYLPDGAIEYLGRIDDQIKLRGVRIEPGEIETTLRQHPLVKEAAIVVVGADDRRQLLACMVLHEPIDPCPDWQSFLASRLPAALVPNQYIVCDRLPTTPNGKLDRQSLISLHSSSTSRLHPPPPPRNSTEAMIADIWRFVLQVPTVGVMDNFFELGGNSLLATRVNSRLREAFQLDLPLRSLFEFPTIAELAEQIQIIQMTLQTLQTPAANVPGRKEIEL